MRFDLYKRLGRNFKSILTNRSIYLSFITIFFILVALKLGGYYGFYWHIIQLKSLLSNWLVLVHMIASSLHKRLQAMLQGCMFPAPTAEAGSHPSRPQSTPDPTNNPAGLSKSFKWTLINNPYASREFEAQRYVFLLDPNRWHYEMRRQAQRRMLIRRRKLSCTRDCRVLHRLTFELRPKVKYKRCESILARRHVFLLDPQLFRSNVAIHARRRILLSDPQLLRSNMLYRALKETPSNRTSDLSPYMNQERRQTETFKTSRHNTL